MRKLIKLSPIALATSLAVSAMAVPTLAQAEVSSDLTISSMYLWRGMDISDGKPALSSTVQYDHESGFYAGAWFSTEGTPSRTVNLDLVGVPAAVSGSVDMGSNGSSYEIDAYVGYAKSFGDFGVDVGYASYMYPEAVGSISDSDISEYIVGVSFKDLAVTAYINTDPDNFDDYKYYSIDYSYDKFGFHYGMTDVTSAGGDYNDISVSYAVTEEMSWTVSQASGDAIAANTPADDPLVMVSYSVPLK